MIARLTAAFLLTALLGRATNLAELQALLQTVLEAQTDDQIPSMEKWAPPDLEESIGTFAADEVKALLPIAKRCLQSDLPKVQGAGWTVFLAVSFRLDSAELLELYIDDLGALLKQPEEGVRKGTIYILGSTNPAALPKALGYLIRHLSDKGISSEEIRMSAAGLLEPTHPVDPAVIRLVLDVVTKRADPGLTGGILEQLGLWRINTEEAIEFIRRSLASPVPGVRGTAVETVGKMSVDVSRKLTPDLQRMIANPDETPRN